MKRAIVATQVARITVAAICALALVVGLPACGRSSSSKSDGASSEASRTTEIPSKTLTFAGFDFSIPDHWQGPSSKSTDTRMNFVIDPDEGIPVLMFAADSVTLDSSKTNYSAELNASQNAITKNLGSAQLVSSTDVTIAGLPGRVFQYTISPSDGDVTLRCAVIIDAKNSQVVYFTLFEEANADTSYSGDFDAIVSSATVSSVASTTTTAPTTTNTSSKTTYEDIYNEYTQKLQDATPGLIGEYNQEAAANTDGVTGLATICDKKISKLASISTEGTEKMAQLMYTSGSGSYQDYEDWATKLNDVYITEAQKITDAYMDSAI